MKKRKWCPPKRNKAQKDVGKFDISLNHICLLETQHIVIAKNWRCCWNYRWKARALVKTSKQKDQYKILLNLAVWPGEPPEIHFSGKCGIPKFPRNMSEHIFPNKSKNHFPGLGTFRWAMWTTYFYILLIFQIFFDISVLTVLEQFSICFRILRLG